VSSRVTTPSVHRRYHVAPDYCARALELLLKNSTRKKGTCPVPPTMRERIRMLAPRPTIADDHDLLSDLRELLDRHPEMVGLEPYELQWPLFALGYRDGLVGEAEIAAVLAALTVEGQVLP
jgi:hypothetical protein